MALHSQRQILRRHSLAIIAYANDGRAAFFDPNEYFRRAGVKRVFDQFLNHRRGPLDHFAGGDTARHFFREDAYFHVTAQSSKTITHGWERSNQNGSWTKFSPRVHCAFPQSCSSLRAC